MNSSSSDSEREVGDDFTDEQNDLVTQLLQVCSDQSLESCKKALLRHNFNIDRAALELLSADTNEFPEPNPVISTTSSNIPAGPGLLESNSNENVDQQIDNSDLIPPAGNNNPRVVHSDINGLRQRTIPEMLQAQAARLNQVHSNASSGPSYRPNNNFPGPVNRSQSSSTSRARPTYASTARTAAAAAINQRNSIISSSLIPASIRNLFHSFFQIFAFPLTVLTEILSRIFPVAKVSSSLSALTVNRNNLTPIKEVDLSIKSLQSFDKDFKTINFFRGSYNEVLSRCKSEAKYLILYLHVPENEGTEQFLKDGNTLIKKFIEEEEALIWTCRLDTREGAHVANELFIHNFPCIALLAPVSSARVSCIQQIDNCKENSGWKDLLEAKENFTGELVLLREEKRKRDSDVRLRKEQENEYSRAIQADLERQQVKEQAKAKEEEKRKTITDKRNAIALAKDHATEILNSLPDLDNFESIDSEPTTKVNVRMPDGSTMQKTYLQSSQIKHIRALILTNAQITSLNFEIQSRFPNKTFKDPEENLEQAFGGGKNQLLFIQSAKDETLADNSQGEGEESSSSEDTESSSDESE